MKNTIAIGDVHGLTNWKEIVEDEKNRDCRFVFLGDYFDPYEEMKAMDVFANFLDIVYLKKEHWDDVVLLLGNHDMHYIYDDFPKGTRYDEKLAPLFRDQFRDYWDCFQIAYQEGNTLFTHAGISNGWWELDFLPLLDKSTIKYDDGIMNVAEILNNAIAHQREPQEKNGSPASESLREAMFQVGYRRGGDCAYGGIFWADLSETYNDPLKGFRQVVGHSRISSVQTFNIAPQTQITFCDCLHKNMYQRL